PPDPGFAVRVAHVTIGGVGINGQVEPVQMGYLEFICELAGRNDVGEQAFSGEAAHAGRRDRGWECL
ncbi:MAG: hypothetical protein ACRDTJ_00475, partial [Pseudonocardiaceae bacterium]